jgi:hypothetical protein
MRKGKGGLGFSATTLGKMLTYMKPVIARWYAQGSIMTTGSSRCLIAALSGVLPHSTERAQQMRRVFLGAANEYDNLDMYIKRVIF